MKKLAALLMILSLGLFTAVGCGDQTSQPKGGTTPPAGGAAKPATKPGEKPAGEKPAGEKPAGEKPAGEKPAGEKPAAK
jgi:hypothetical protein